jgi:hypothetical protein
MGGTSLLQHPRSDECGSSPCCGSFGGEVSYFIGELDTRLVDELKDHHKLLAPFAFHSSLLAETVVVPMGFITDFASVPRIIGAWLLYGGKGKRASVLHDWLYSSKLVSRSISDAVFEEALKASGYASWEVSGMYAGVRVGGWVAWNKENVPQTPAVQQVIEAP